MSERRSLARPSDVATYLGKPLRTLEQWRYHRRGPAFVKIGGEVRYRWEDVDAWILANRKAS